MKIFTWKQRGIVWATTAATVLTMGGLGYGIDTLAGTPKIFFILGIIGSFPVNAMLLKRNILKYGIDKSIQ